MAAIFDALPGIEVPVGAITRNLAQMWEDTATKGGPAPSSDDAKATQVNFVLHLGYNTTAEDAVVQFQTAVRFSQRAPCRVVVLCPLPMDDRSEEMRAKIYGECHLGKTKGDTRCCEFVLLSYPFAARRFLESQLSVCLTSDLPLFYWVHRFASIHRLGDYHGLLCRAERIIIDSAIAPADYATFPWPNPGAVHDLVYARLLPVRQSIGQFLSTFEPAALADGLRGVTVSHSEDLTAEARVLQAWACERLAGCGKAAGVECVAKPLKPGASGSLGLTFDYANGHCFAWQGDLAKRSACFEADFGTGRALMHSAVSLLEPEAALSDAMFF